MPDRDLKLQLFDGFARIAGALASGRRAEIVDVLGNGERSVESLAEEVGLSLANTSQHLQVLKEAGLVVGSREGNRVMYRLASPGVYDFWAGLRSVAVDRLPAVRMLVDAYLGSRDGLEALDSKELLRRLRSPEPPILLDVRPTVEYGAGHLPGAVSIPVDQLESRLRELPRDRDVVAYCRGPYCALAPEAVRIMRRQGYRAHRLEDGLPEWRAAGKRVETNANPRAPLD